MLNLTELEKKMNDVDALQIFTTDLNGRSVTLQVHAGNAASFLKRGLVLMEALSRVTERLTTATSS